MLRIARKVIGLCIVGFLVINCDRIFPDISTKDMKPGIERSLAKGFNVTKGAIGSTSNRIWKKAEPKLKDYGKKSLKNTEKIIEEKAKEIDRDREGK